MESSELRNVLRYMFEEDLPRRKHREAAVPQHAHIELAAVDVLLDQGVAIKLLVNEPRSFDRLTLITDKGRLADAVRRLLAHRLDKTRVFESSQTAKRRQTMGDDEVGQAYMMV